MGEITYTGWKKWTPTNDEWTEFITDKKVPFQLVENEYLLVYGADNELTEQYIMKNGVLKKIGRTSIQFSVKKEIATESDNNTNEKGSKNKRTTTTNKYKKEKNNCIYPLNDEQICAFNLLEDDTITCKLLSGSFGSGKTMLAVYEAMHMLETGKVNKIVWLRNNINAAGTESIGFLPGTETEKVRPWLMPLIDHLQSETRVEKMLEKGQLETPSLCFIRGRNIENAIVICTEAQNLTEELVKLILGRIGEGSYLIFDGDFKHQTDKPLFAKSPGIQRMIEVLAGNSLFGYVDLPKSERSATARLADEFDKK